MHTRLITELTRQDIREVYADDPWWGRLDDVSFLSRLYRLEDLPSHDSRHATAREDIARHRLANSDWPDDWVFDDERFGLTDGSDDTLLRFLVETLHPVVCKSRDESERLARRLNDVLRADGYQLVPTSTISGRPLFGWKRMSDEEIAADRASVTHFTTDVRPLLATLLTLADLSGSELEREVLRTATPRLEEPEYDNWNGGTYYYTLTLAVPVEVFAKLGEKVNSLEQAIAKRVEQVLRSPDSRKITAVVIQPSLVAADPNALARAVQSRTERADPEFWSPGQFRLFLSHVSSFKQRTAALKQALNRYQISGFVAHDMIEPGALWQREIEAALRTMDAMAALLTPGFPESKWTDQEVGWALGRGVYVLPIRRGLDPYGFLGEVQGIQGIGRTVKQVADGVFVALLRQNTTRRTLLEALTAGVERARSPQQVLDLLTLLQRGGGLPRGMADRVRTATGSYTAPEIREQLRRLASAARSDD